MHRVHGEATECVVFIGRQQNVWEPTDWVETECVVVFINRTSYVQNGVLLIGRGVAYHKMEKTDLLRSKRGSC